MMQICIWSIISLSNMFSSLEKNDEDNKLNIFKNIKLLINDKQITTTTAHICKCIYYILISFEWEKSNILVSSHT